MYSPTNSSFFVCDVSRYWKNVSMARKIKILDPVPLIDIAGEVILPADTAFTAKKIAPNMVAYKD